MKIETYLINLDGSTARLASAKEQLDAAGWAFKRYAAYDGRGKNIRDFTNYDDRQAKKILRICFCFYRQTPDFTKRAPKNFSETR